MTPGCLRGPFKCLFFQGVLLELYVRVKVTRLQVTTRVP